MNGSFKDLLNETLALRVRRNPSYSLRALARDLNMAPSTISEIMSGKNLSSARTINKVAVKLNLSRSVIAELLENEDGEDSEETELSYYEFDQAEFSLIAEWYYLAILALVDRTIYIDESEKVAVALGIEIIDAERAIVQLCELDLLRQEPDGRLTNEFRSTFVPDGVAPRKMKEFHTRILAMAKDALMHVPREQRFFETRFLNLCEDGYFEVQQILIEAAKKIEQVSNKYEKATTVYNVAWQLFPAHGDMEKRHPSQTDNMN